MSRTRISGRVARLAKIFLAMAVLVLAVPAFASAATFNVDTDDATPDGISAGVDCGTPSGTNRCNTIAKGVEEAEQFDGDGPGDTVKVFPGEDTNAIYNESVTVTESGLNILGPHEGDTGDSRSPSPSVENEAIVNPGGTGNAAFIVNGDEVTIDGFAILDVDNEAGVDLKGADATLQNNIIRDNTVGVFLEGADSGNVITENAFYDNDEAGPGPTPFSAAGNAIYGDTAGADDLSITSNKFQGNDNASATLVPGATPYDNLTIDDNDAVSEPNIAFNINGVTGSEITDNRINDTGGSALVIGGGDGLSITGNVLNNSTNSGIRFAAADFGYQQNKQVTVEGNDITSNGATGNDGAGIRNVDDAFVDDPSADELEIHANRIFGNSDAAPGNIGGGLRNEDNGGAIDVDAINNWFGCNEGPAVPSNDCDDVVGPVDSAPFLTFSVTADPTSDTVPGGASTITGDYLTNSDGDIDPAVEGGNVSDLFPSVEVTFTQASGPGNLVSFPSGPVEDPQSVSTSGGAASARIESDDPGTAVVEGTSDTDLTGVTNNETGMATVEFTAGGGASGTPTGGGGTNTGTGTGAGSKVINGTSGDDTITGTAGNDVINCGAGDDIVNGRGGNDVINCGDGNDTVHGNAGDDRINGQGDSDKVSGDAGKDRVSGGSGEDRVAGNGGKDRVNGNTGNDRVSGGSSNDRVSGSGGKDRLSGNSGRDRLSGGSGNDRLFGGSGNDKLSGNGGNDKLYGNRGKDKLSGNGGNDKLSGNGGDDRLLGGSGDDRLVGGAGEDVLKGGSGDNALIQ